jgi:hypothetical protein
MDDMHLDAARLQPPCQPEAVAPRLVAEDEPFDRSARLLASDRTSCRSPLANQMRLTLHTAVYWLMRTLRDAIPRPLALASGEFSTILLRLLKIAVRVRETASRIRLAFAANCRTRRCSGAWFAG